MTLVVALGGNALLRPGELPGIDQQRSRLREVSVALAPLCAANQVVITHGNGPQIGNLALAAAAGPEGTPDTLDALGAESEGLIGYLIEQELRNRLPGREVVSLLTQVLVDAGDPAFANPTKPIGPHYEQSAMEWLRRRNGWQFAEDGRGFRRLVASPEPRRVLEVAAIRCLLDAGMVVVCGGGGGIPVVLDPADGLRGVSAVVDKDLATALLAEALGARTMLLLTNVDAVYEDWNTATARPLPRATPARLRAMAFAPGTMAPKVEAACRFVSVTGGTARIGHLDDTARLMSDLAGTLVVPDGPA